MRVHSIASLLAVALPTGCGVTPAPPQHRVSQPAMVTAAAWGSKPQPLGAARRHTPVRVTVHHSGVAWRSTDDPETKIRALQTWGQRDKAWPDVPYHFMVAPDGRIFEGRDLGYLGETNTEYDTRDHALVCLWGNFGVQRCTQAQLATTVHLIAWLCQEHQIDTATIAGHRDWSEQTSCPGTDLYGYVESGRLRDWTEALLRGETPQVEVGAQQPGGPSKFAGS